MDPDIDDPNNHVPKVTAGDDWDDLDSDAGRQRLGLPPRRTERGLPPKKEAKGPTVKRHEPKSVAARPVEESDDSREESDGSGEGRPGNTGRKVAKRPVKKTARKVARKVAKKTAGNSVKRGAAGDTDKGPETPEMLELIREEEDPKFRDFSTEEEEGVRLPPAPTGKPNRLRNQIGTGDSKDSDPRPATRPIQKISGTPHGSGSDGSDEEMARLRRRFVRGERQDWGEEKGRDSAKWMLYTGIGVVLLVILAVVLSQVGGNGKTRESDRSQYGKLAPTKEKAAEETADLEMLEMLTNSQQEAKEIYAKVSTAATASELSGFLFNRDAVLPLLEKNWKQPVSKEDWVPGDAAIWTVLDSGGKRYGVLEGSHPDFSDYSAYFRNSPEGLRIDWKATGGYGTATFDELKGGAGDGSEIRARISLSDFYTFALPEGKFRSFRLMSPDGSSNLWVYTHLNGEMDQRLMELFIPSEITGEAQSEVQVTLSLEPGPEDGLPNQWIVRDIISLTWLDELQK